MPLVFDASTDELQFFLQEAEEQFQILDDGLLELERSGPRGDLLQDIFRAAHTLKGSSATIGHVRMAELTHHLEDVFDKLRQEKIDVSTELVDASLQALDALRVLGEEVSTLEEVDVDILPILTTLANVEDGGKIETEVATTYRISVSFEPDHPLMAARALQLTFELAAEGHIHELMPDRNAIEREGIKGELQATVEWPEGRAHLEELLRSVPEVIAATVEPHSEPVEETARLYRVFVKLDERNELRAARAMQLLLHLETTGRILSSVPTVDDISAERFGNSLEIQIDWPTAPSTLEAAIMSIPDIDAFCVDEIADVNSPVASPAPPVPLTPQEGTGAGRRKQPASGNTIRISVERIDRMLDYVGELVIERSRISDTAR
ncbi:MAG: Hpt domain-containing protein, partial [Thermomicrobiales bacterium]